jgi:hypothetical protein
MVGGYPVEAFAAPRHGSDGVEPEQNLSACDCWSKEALALQ